jgi:hypothetical protein
VYSKLTTYVGLTESGVEKVVRAPLSNPITRSHPLA